MNEFETWWNQTPFATCNDTTKVIARRAWEASSIDDTKRIYDKGYNAGWDDGYNEARLTA
jgi:hypothetical protein